MKTIKRLMALVVMSGTLGAHFSPELIKLRKDIEVLDQNITKQSLEMSSRWDAISNSRDKEAERIDQEIAKKMIQMQKYWPEIKKELDGPCNGVSVVCEEQKGTSASLCKECAELMTLMFESLRHQPDKQLLLDLKPYAGK